MKTKKWYVDHAAIGDKEDRFRLQSDTILLNIRLRTQRCLLLGNYPAYLVLTNGSVSVGEDYV